MSASTTPDRAMSPSRARAPEAEMDALRRKLAEQKALNEAAARDFSEMKEHQVRASRASRARATLAMRSSIDRPLDAHTSVTTTNKPIAHRDASVARARDARDART